jgi:acetoacetyl-CoA synthetase
MDWLANEWGVACGSYDELHAWSVGDLDGFWASVWDFFAVRADTPYERVLGSRAMPGAQWFPGARLNYAEHLLLGEGADGDSAVLAYSQSREPLTLTWGDLRRRSMSARAGLAALGVGPGDRVAAYLPNIPEALIAFIATASLGAIWAACPPEFGARAVLDRFSQIEPKVLLAVGGYGYRDRVVDRRAELAEIRAGLSSVEHVVSVAYPDHVISDALAFEDLLDLTPSGPSAPPGSGSAPVQCLPVAFDHPLCVLFSSGTTGLPKAIVHGHGGLLLEHLKNLGLSWDLNPGDRLLQFTTTAWMMWTVLVSALLRDASIVMLDGDPTWPDLGTQWELAGETGATVMGASPAWVMACRRAGVTLHRPLPALRTLLTSGSPLPGDGYRWLYQQLGPDFLLMNASGGTDVCSGLVSGSHLQPVWEGEISGPCLGVDVVAFDAAGAPVIGEFGEMVVRAPMPSMPLAFWGDVNGQRYRDAYFATYPGIWRQGDLICFSDRGSCTISGRSDATLNRGGVRLGTGEIYRTVEEMPEVLDSLIVHVEGDGEHAGQLVLFIVCAPGVDLSPDLTALIRRRLATDLSPRHVPDRWVQVPAIPRTLTGKKLEAPIKRILEGADPDSVLTRDALAAPDAVDAFLAYARAEALPDGPLSR